MWFVQVPSAEKSLKNVGESCGKDNEKNIEDDASFADKNNILRRAVDRARKKTKKEEVEFYDSDEDQDNEQWVSTLRLHWMIFQ